MRTFRGQICKVCLREDYFGYDVSDETWQAVVPPVLQNKVVCLGCFDAFAYQKHISYVIDAIFFAGDQECFIFHRTTAEDKR